MKSITKSSLLSGLFFSFAFLFAFLVIPVFDLLAQSNSSANIISYSKEDVGKMTISGKRLYLNGAKLNAKQVGAAISVLDQNLGNKYIRNRKVANAGLAIWLTGAAFNLISYATIETDDYGFVERSSAGTALSTVGSILAPSGLITFIVGAVKVKRAFRDFSVIKASKYSSLHSSPSFSVEPFYNSGGAIPASGGMRLTIGF